MDEDKRSGYGPGVGVLIFGVGLLFGGFLVYLIMKNSQMSSVLSPPVSTPSLSQPLLYPQTISSQVAPQAVYSQVAPSQATPHYVMPSQVVPSQVMSSHAVPNLQQEQEKVYKNNEKWVVERGPDGRIKSLSVIRDAKIK